MCVAGGAHVTKFKAFDWNSDCRDVFIKLLPGCSTVILHAQWIIITYWGYGIFLHLIEQDAMCLSHFRAFLIFQLMNIFPNRPRCCLTAGGNWGHQASRSVPSHPQRVLSSAVLFFHFIILSHYITLHRLAPQLLTCTFYPFFLHDWLSPDGECMHQGMRYYVTVHARRS